MVQKATEKLRKGIADQLEKENSPKQKFKSANEFMRKKFKAGGGNLTKGTMKSKKFQAALSKVSPSSKLSTGELNAVTKRFSVDDTTTSFVDFMYRAVCGSYKSAPIHLALLRDQHHLCS